MDAYTFTTDLPLEEIESRLSGLEKFDLKEKTRASLSANVGSSAKYRFLGSWFQQDYQAPIEIEVSEGEGGTATVLMARRAPILVGSKKDSDFFRKGFEEIKRVLDGR